MKNFANNSTKKTIDDILEYYYSKIEGNYIPGILSEGNLFNDGNELYIKIIAKQKNVEINKTWIKDNLDKDYSDEIFNIISSYKYNYNDIYGINPILLNDDVTFVEQDDIDVFSMEYVYNNNKVKRDKILYKRNDNIMVYFPLIKDYSDLSYDYELYAEIEYRVYFDGLAPDRIGAYADEQGNFIDLIYTKKDNFHSGKYEDKFLYWLRATMKLKISEKMDDQKETFNIKVVELGKNEIRDLNLRNYNDDIETGFIVFSGEAVTEIRKYYYFYDLRLVPKLNHVKSSLVDYFDNIIVFWEGEFNSKLPLELKKALQKFNLDNRKEKIISNAMFNWQLQGNWNVFNDLYPNQQLARIVSDKYESIAIDYQLDFYPPLDITEYSSFIKKILSIFDLNKDQLNLPSEKEQMLEKIINKEYIFNNNDEMINNYYGFCNLLVKVVEYAEK